MRWIVGWAERFGRPLGGLWRRTEPLRADVLRLLYPPRCALCDADLATSAGGAEVCDGCETAIATPNWVACDRCAGPLQGSESPVGSCFYCRRWGLDFDTTVALAAYRGRLREAVLRMKWKGGEPIAEALGQLFCARRGDSIRALRPDVVVPVPMHWSRRWVRGTNSPDILAAKVASFLHLPCRSRLLKLTRNIPAQKGLGMRERRRNLDGAFRVAKGYDIRDARVLLVDDVLTTGATCHFAAKSLKTAGAVSVAVAVLARTIPEWGG